MFALCHHCRRRWWWQQYCVLWDNFTGGSGCQLLSVCFAVCCMSLVSGVSANTPPRVRWWWSNWVWWRDDVWTSWSERRLDNWCTEDWGRSAGCRSIDGFVVTCMTDFQPGLLDILLCRCVSWQWTTVWGVCNPSHQTQIRWGTWNLGSTSTI